MSDKQTTKERLLQAACKNFANKGYRDATVAEICEQAEANISAVNYYFGDKEKLYDEVWRHAFSITTETYPLDDGLPENPTIENLLFTYTNAMVHRIFCEEEAGLFPKLLCREMASPTLALDRIGREALLPQSQYMRKIIAVFLGEGFSEQQLHYCLNSIIGQCVFYNFSRPLRERVLGKKMIGEEEMADIARHIATFSLGGLKEIKKG